jgi:hypothetical protein
LPAPDWRTELGNATSLEVVEQRYRELARTRHPDHGGSVDDMARLNAARDAARRELGGNP